MNAAGRRIGLVGCVKSKLPHAAPAKDLYTSPLFRGRRAWVERTCERWFILSAEHGLVEPDAWLEPYDKSLVTARTAERRAWAVRVLQQMVRVLGPVHGRTFEIHAGASYFGFGLEDELVRAGSTVDVPTRGMSQGRQLALYLRAARGV